MKVARTGSLSRRSKLLSYFSLFTSLSTLLCCALPSLLVLIGFGASVASMLSFMPWLVVLSRHKTWTFSVAGTMIALGFINVYYLTPRLNMQEACDSDDPSACRDASRMAKVLLWLSAAICAGGLFVAYALGPLLTRLGS